MIELKTQEQEKEYEQEIARIKARADAQLNDSNVRKANNLNIQYSFMLTFILTIVGACFGFLLGVLVK